jgi:DNA end-binding protein Ku
VRAIDDVGPTELPKADPRMLDIARKIIEQQAGKFDPTEFTDRYEDALRALIEEKRKGLPVRPTEAPPPENVVNLMDALRKSLDTSARTPPAASAPERTVAPEQRRSRPTATAKPKKAANTNRTPRRRA